MCTALGERRDKIGQPPHRACMQRCDAFILHVDIDSVVKADEVLGDLRVARKQRVNQCAWISQLLATERQVQDIQVKNKTATDISLYTQEKRTEFCVVRCTPTESSMGLLIS
jgi:hypothetical protein